MNNSPANDNYYYTNGNYGIYDARMSEFCMNYLNRTNNTTIDELQRPKCSISPINLEPCINPTVPILDSSLYSNTNNIQSNHYKYPQIIIPSINNIFQDSGIGHSFNNSSFISSPLNSLTNKITHTSTNTSLFKSVVHNQSIQNHENNNLLRPTPLANVAKSLQFQSTPNKSSFTSATAASTTIAIPTENQHEHLKSTKNKRTNFHSILDLAKSSSGKQKKFNKKFFLF